MTSRIWELHAHTLGGAIRTTPDGEADVAGLVLSEKAYLIAVRDFRPRYLVQLVQSEGPYRAAERLVAHYATPEAVALSGGRTLVATGRNSPWPAVRRNDELREPVGPPGRL